MRPAHLPRYFAILLLILLVSTFLAGNVLVFSGVHAATQVTPTPTLAVTTTAQVLPTTTPQPVQSPPSADTTGILILGILLVAIILIGLLWGSRIGRK
jgi:hypothetical protein